MSSSALEVSSSALDIDTRLPNHNLNIALMDAGLGSLGTHRMTTLGEQKDVTLYIGRRAFEASL
jgi:hypothetical protein